MKRYRWLNFYIDTLRNFLKTPGLPPEERAKTLFQFAENVGTQYGIRELKSKLDRWLQIKLVKLGDVLHHVN